MLVVYSCSDDNKSVQNDFSFGDSSLILNNVYYFIANPNFTDQEFFLILTDGSVESFSVVTNYFTFSSETKNALILRGKKYFEDQIPTNQIPAGSYIYDADISIDTFLFSNILVDCEPYSRGDLELF